MKISNKGIELLKEFEGVVPYEYICKAGYPTISKGIRTDLLSQEDINNYTRLVDKSQVTPIKIGNVLIAPNIVNDKVRIVTNESELISKVLKPFEQCINKYVKVPIKQSQYDALISLVYNIGTKGFINSSVLRQINKCEPPLSWLLWNKANGKVLAGLDKRRRKEYEIFTKSEY